MGDRQLGNSVFEERPDTTTGRPTETHTGITKVRFVDSVQRVPENQSCAP